MLQVGCLHNGHDSSYSHAVICPKCGAFRTHPAFFINVGLNGICLEIVLTFGRFLWHHVHVSLHKYGLSVLHSSRCRLAHYDVVALVYISFDTYLTCKVE